MLKGAEVAARALGVRVQFVEARGLADFDRAFSDMTRAHAGALLCCQATGSSESIDAERGPHLTRRARNRLSRDQRPDRQTSFAIGMTAGDGAETRSSLYSS
jgi:hypothetical protein